MDKLGRIVVVSNSDPKEGRFVAVLYGNGGPTDFRAFPGDSLNSIFDDLAAYLEEKHHG